MVVMPTFAHPAHGHGGPDALGVPLHDFSTNSNACGPCPQALAAVQSCDASRYPDPTYAALRAQLAAFHGVHAQRIVLAGSASEFIFRITAWVARCGGHTVRVPLNGYSDYAQAARAWGLAVTPSGPADLHWHADPSSPLGQSPVDATLPDTAGTVVLDCAYEPLRLSGSPAFAPSQLCRVWQLWTPNKALGLTGVRAAYAIAPRDAVGLVAELEHLCASWPVGAHGVALLQAWTQPTVQAWLAGSLRTLKVWKARQIALLESLGWCCLPSHANYFSARPSADDLNRGLDTGFNSDLNSDLDLDFPSLRRHGIKLRNAASFGLFGHVRLGVLPPAAQDALALALAQLASQTSAGTTPGALDLNGPQFRRSS